MTKAHIKPIYGLLDNDGLPTTISIRYNPANPKEVVFPMVIGTWFLPGMLVLLGLVCTIVGTVFFYWANKPIEVPYIAPPETQTPAPQATAAPKQPGTSSKA
jgi:hypothetical protein